MTTHAQTNPSPGASVGLLLGGLAFAGAAYWLLRDQEEEDQAVAEEEGQVPPEPKFDPVDTEALTLSDDCKLVTVGSNWMANIAFPSIQQQVQQLGRGLSLYPAPLRDRSVDATVRQVLSPYNPCVADVLWRDVYMANNPFPYIEPIYNSTVARQKIGEWEQARSIAWTAWAGQHMQLATVVGALRDLTRQMYFANLGVDLQHVPVDEGTYQAAVFTQSDKNRLMSLGYDLDENVVEAFQNHYNLAKNFQTQGQWEAAQLNLVESNIIDDETRDALVDAQSMQSFYGAWMGLVETSVNA